MSFSGDVKTELCRSSLHSTEEALAEAYGVMLFCSRCTPDNLRVITESGDFAERIPVLFRKVFLLDFDRYPESCAEGRMVFEITQKSKLTMMLDRCGYDPGQLLSLHINFGLLETPQSRLAFLRGAFLAGGSVTDPQKRYHLELSTSHPAVSREMLSVLEECGFQGKNIVRKGNYLIYFKQGSEIVRLLEYMGARASADLIRQAMLQKGSVNKANRRSNCDLANVDKMINASQTQLAAIRRLEENGRLTELPEKLQEAAALRVQYPELSLSQLGELCEPPVSKSSFNNRLKKLIQMAETYRSPEPASSEQKE